jgi:hypothetical protein
MQHHRSFGLRTSGACVALMAALWADSASAKVKLEGSWENEPKVSIDLKSTPRNEALVLVAKKAGQSVVSSVSEGPNVDLTLVDQPLGKVLSLLLADGDYVATRDGTLISITKVTTAPSANDPAPPSPVVGPPPSVNPFLVPTVAPIPEPLPVPAVPGRERRDVTVMGNEMRIGPNEEVNDVAVMGGSVEIEGRVTGDLAVMGGRAHLKKGAHVLGDATAMGGAITIDEGAKVDGDIGALGGVIQGSDHAKPDGETSPARFEESPARRTGHAISSAISGGALLFVLGAIAIALGEARVETLRGEIAARPMKSFAIGVVGLLAALVILATLCVTIIGIPFAAIGALIGIAVAFTGLTCVLTVVGSAIASHKTKNIYVHLAIGCLLWVIVGAIPVIGDLACWFAILTGIGAGITTRFGGLFVGKSALNPHPYRA